MKGEESNRNSCHQRAEPLLQRTESCPSRWAQPAQQPPASPGAGPAPAQGDFAVSTDPQSSAVLTAEGQLIFVRCAAPQPSPQLQAPPFPAPFGASLEIHLCPSTAREDAQRLPLQQESTADIQAGSRSTQELHVLMKVWFCDCFGDTAPNPGTREVVQKERGRKGCCPLAAACTSVIWKWKLSFTQLVSATLCSAPDESRKGSKGDHVMDYSTKTLLFLA